MSPPCRRVSRAGDDAGEAWSVEQHANAQLRDAESAARRNRANLVDRLEVTLEARARVILVRAATIIGGKGLVLVPGAEQQAAEQRRVGNDADVVRGAPREDVVFDGRPEDAVRRLIGVQRHAGRAPLLELRHREVRHANRADLSGLEQRGACGRGLARSAAAPASAADTGRCDRRRAAAGSPSHSALTSAAAADRLAASLSTPRPNFVKIRGRFDAGSCLTARPTTSSEWPDP